MFLQPGLCTQLRTSILSFGKLFLVRPNPLVEFVSRRTPPEHQCSVFSKLATEPFVGYDGQTRVYYNQPTTPLAHWPFRRQIAGRLEVSPEVILMG